MSLSDIVTDVENIFKEAPAEIETGVENLVDASYAAAKPILQEVVASFDADITANAANPATLMSTAAAIATAALPKLVAAEITAAGTTVLGWISNMLAGHPAVAAAQAAPTLAAS